MRALDGVTRFVGWIETDARTDSDCDGCMSTKRCSNCMDVGCVGSRSTLLHLKKSGRGWNELAAEPPTRASFQSNLRQKTVAFRSANERLCGNALFRGAKGDHLLSTTFRKLL